MSGTNKSCDQPSKNGNTMLNGKTKIAYFSMEIGLKSEIPTYSGGLGVLAGDTIRAAADLNLPMVAISLVSRKGYFRQRLTPEGQQIEESDSWEPSQYMDVLPAEITVPLYGRAVKVRAWQYDVVSPAGRTVPALLLDTDVEGNLPSDRAITNYLYGGDMRYRLEQEVVLGIGGVRMLDALGYKIRRYHMNEGHSALLALELLKKNGLDHNKVRDMCVFTTHTPVEAAFDKFPYMLFDEVLPGYIPQSELRALSGGDGFLNMARLALNLSSYVNGVTKRHSEQSQVIFPGYRIKAITNGIHSYTWTCECFRNLYDKYITGWAIEPSLLVRASVIPDEELVEAHRGAKKSLIDFINSTTGAAMDYETLTIGFARRATGYKRANMIFSDLERLKSIASGGKIQLVYAGKAHPRDEPGKAMIREIFRYARDLKDEIKIVYLEGYNMDLALKIISGVDLWLNTPQPPMEASGTSGMKAAHNGVINFSVLDGWWIEGWMEGITGWAIGPPPDLKLSDQERRRRELRDLYNKLEYIILPMFYDRKDEWHRMMTNSIEKVASYFNSHRMMSNYVMEAYL